MAIDASEYQNGVSNGNGGAVCAPNDSLTTIGEDGSIPIAIIGIGGRFPGEATNPEKLWDMVSEGRNAMGEVPKDRFNIDAFYHPHAERQGTMNVRGGNFLKDDVSVFDAPFFSITPKEANAMDPQQRMALELAYEGLENAGMRIEDVAGTSMACFMASFTRDYSSLRAHDPEDLPMYEATGNGSTLISNRISWFFDLSGPSVSLDTACSSSLVALHLACQSLRTGECESAIVGGTNLILMPEMQISMTSLHFLSPDCKSHSFDHRANGYARGEGAAVVILKPLAHAIRDNNVIRAVIRGTGVNQDGKTPGITLPLAKAQQDLIELTYKNAGLDYSATDYFESHGTGTPAGDPLECSAIGATLGLSRTEDNPLIVGSVKTNVGHMEGASGLAGLIKAVYALEKGQIPPNLWFEKANPRIPMSKWGIKIPTRLMPWPKTGLRRASVNSFGYGGTNAHCILDDAYHYLTARGMNGQHVTATEPILSTSNGYALAPTDGQYSNGNSLALRNGHEAPKILPKLIMWSSHEQIGLERSATSLLEYLRTQKNPSIEVLERLAFTLAEKRSRLPWKSYVVASTVEELCARLEKFSTKPIRSLQAPVLEFIFTGQGAQWFAMGRELLAYPAFRGSLQRAEQYLISIECSWNLTDEMLADEESSRINEPELSQTLCTALQVALVDLLAHWNVRPSVVVGHSSGEIAAAYAKGAITSEDAWKIAYHRGRLSSSLEQQGAMLAVGLGEDAVQPYLSQVTDGKIVVACINSPLNVTLSGDSAGISQVQALLEADKVFARRLVVKTAYHSPHMQQLADKYLASLQDLRPLAADDSGVVMFSSVTGRAIQGDTLGTAEYWVSNMTNPVKFSQAVQASLAFKPNRKRTLKNAQYINVLVEVGPHSALQGPTKQIVSGHEQGKLEMPYISVLTRGNGAVQSSLEALGRLIQHGYSVDIAKANEVSNDRCQIVALTDMPPFAWNRSNRYWYESPISSAFRKREFPRHDLFGALSPHSSKLEPSWSNYLRVSEMPWMEHHKVQSSILYPFAGMIVMAIEASRQIADRTKDIEGFHLRDISADTAIMVPPDEPVETKLQFRPWRLGSRLPDSFWHEFTISCRNREGVWQQHCSGLVTVSYKHTTNEAFADETAASNRKYREEYERLVKAGFKSDDPRQVYASMAELGLQWGPTFTNLTYIGSGNYEAHCVLEIPDTKKFMPENFEYPHVIHPATLDTIIQMMVPALTPANVPLEKARIPRFVESAYISAKISSKPGDKLHGYSRSKPYGFNESLMTVVASDSEWNEPLVIIEGCRAVALETMTEGIATQAITKSLRKLGAHPTWDVDVEHLPLDVARKYFGRTSDAIPDTSWNIIRDLELAAFILCKRVLRRYSPKDAEKFAPHLQQFYRFMQYQYQLATEGTLNCQTKDFDWLETTEAFDEELLSRVAASSLDGKLMCRQGAVLNKIFSGELEPLQVLREEDLLTEYYRGGIGTDKWNPIIHDFVRGMAHKKDLRILEVGAGTGGTTTVVLSALGGRDAASARLRSYTFTDISSGFFEAASEDFKEWAAFLEYKVLNIEKDPFKQGLPLEYYDLVIANNVLHATSSIDTCLANCKSMLKPGGTLLLVELTGTMSRVPLIFGTLSGLWNGVNDNRNWGPMLTEPGWNTRLQQQGFSGIDMCFRDHSTEDYSVSLMISRALPLPAETLPEKILLIEPAEPDESNKRLKATLLKSLATQGVQVETAGLAQVKEFNIRETTCVAMLEATQPFLPDISEKDFELVKHLILQSARTLWLTNGAAIGSEVPEANMMAGLGRTIRGENASIELTLLDLDPTGTTDLDSTEAAILRVLRSSANAKNVERPDWEYALRDGMIHVSRLEPDAVMNELLEESADQPPPEMLPFNQPGRPLALAVRTPGMLDTFQFVDDIEHHRPLAENDVEISVEAVGMNFHDVMIAMGQISDTDLGVECSGRVVRTGQGVTKYKPGDKVITFRLGCYRTLLRNPEQMFQMMPEDMSFEAAATLPCVYTTAYYSIFDVARLQRGESILVHAAAGGLGQAAIILAQHIGADIYVTVSSSAKKQFLMETYGVSEDHIFNSRDLTFAKGIKRMTGGRGVDVVLNSLAGEALRQTWLCVAPFGRFIEVVGNTGLDMSPFMENVTFSGVNMLSIYRSNIPLFARVIADMMRLLSEGVIWPIQPMKIMDYSQIEEAFRIMQTGKHIGKMVLKANPDDIVPIVPRKSKPFHLSPDVTYLLPGGLGGLGRSIASWMVDHGARNLVFTSRSGDAKPRAKELIDSLAKRGAKAKAFACDISDRVAFKEVLREVEATFPPIRGILTCAMQLQDSAFENMTIEDYRAAVRPKAQGTQHLHELLPRDLDFFICLSSVGGIVGSRGQGNYNAGNTYQDALVHHRRAQGLKGTSINVGVVLGIGITAERGEILTYLKSGAMIGVREQELLTVVQAAMSDELPVQSSAGLATGGLLKQNGHDEPYWFDDARFAHLRTFDTQSFSVSHEDTMAELQAALVAAATIADASELVCSALMRKLAKAMLMELEDLDSNKPANAYGVDSLVAVEVRAWVFKDVKSDVSVFEILSNAPLTQLAAKIAARSSLVPAAVRGADEG